MELLIMPDFRLMVWLAFLAETLTWSWFWMRLCLNSDFGICLLCWHLPVSVDCFWLAGAQTSERLTSDWEVLESHMYVFTKETVFNCIVYECTNPGYDISTEDQTEECTNLAGWIHGCYSCSGGELHNRLHAPIGCKSIDDKGGWLRQAEDCKAVFWLTESRSWVKLPGNVTGRRCKHYDNVRLMPQK